MTVQLVASAMMLVGLVVTSAAAQSGAQSQQSAAPDKQGAAPAPPTPRLADGKPDLTGVWQTVGGPFRLPYGFRRCSPYQVECVNWTNQTEDFEFEAPSRLGPNRPLYKPEHWDKVQELDMWTNREDPVRRASRSGSRGRDRPHASSILLETSRFSTGEGSTAAVGTRSIE